MADRLEIAAGGSRCVVGAWGGLIHSWRVGDQDMLRASDGSDDPLRAACFPLVPYANRIAGGRFVWNGRDIALPPFAPEPHALHGVGWRRRWEIELVAAVRAQIRYEHDGDTDWPWPFSAVQTVTIEPGRLTIAIAVRNLGDEAAPLAFGLHPYFDAKGARLRFAAENVWANTPDLLPDHRMTPADDLNFAQSSEVERRAIDNCYEGWNGSAEIDWDGRPHGLRIAASPELNQLHIYIPEGGDLFCVEPVPHMPDALNRGEPMPVIAPGKSFSARVEFAVI